MSAFRNEAGGRVDPGRRLTFTFDGQTLAGNAGDTLASALIANGIHLVGRSFKYHRPRGILSAGADEPNALVEIDHGVGRVTPNLRATQVELYDGLVARSQNRWPSLRRDLGAVNDLMAPLYPAGFYYKTFKWPPGLWKRLYEPAIRRAAGLGRAPVAPDPDRYLHRYAHCEVLVIGAGPAGLAAALAAAAAGVRVILADEQAEAGGSLLAETAADIESVSASDWLADALGVLARCDNVRLLPRTTAFGWYPDNLIGLAERVTDHLPDPDPRLPRERLWQVRAREVVIATGALERPLVFPENDRPGIMLADSARTYAARYGARPGRRAVVVTACDSAYRAAVELGRAGVGIVAIADLRETETPAMAAARAAGIAVSLGTVPTGTRGRRRVSTVHLARAGGASVTEEALACDLVLMSGGWTPAVHLFSQSRGRLRWDDAIQAFVPGVSAARERSAGACRGTFDLARCLEEGYAAGGEAAQRAGAAKPVAQRTFSVGGGAAMGGGCVGAVPAGNRAARAKAFVDFQNDVTAKDIRLATREGFRSIEHVKRYTTTGMATDQGKTSNINALAIAAEALGRPIPEVGHTTFRPPYTPVTFGAFAGAARGVLFDPVRTTPLHGWAEANRAVFEDVGQWKRAHYFPLVGEDMHATVRRECGVVRTGVGTFDASTLGKIEVVGPDAGRFLDLMYTGTFSRLDIGRCRYGLMLSEAGFVIDDGIVGRLAADRFHVTTTTGGAARVLNQMEDYLQTEFPELKAWLTSVTEQWAVIAVQGPRAREVIAPLVEGIDLATGAMPHMSVREGRLAGVPCRLFRVSFTGELGYEVNVPADHGRAVWEAVFEAGRPHGLVPYGTEAMHVLRAEKGYIIVGQETDGTAIPADLGLGGMIARGKSDFVGKRSLTRTDMLKPDRKQLVGLLTEDPGEVLEEGAQIVADPGEPVPMTMLGHVTSSYFSVACNRSIALAMVSGGRARVGSKLYLPMPGRVIMAEVVAPVFYDPEGGRLHG